MCDYSLHAVASRPAKVGETLITTTFPRTSTRGFAAEGEPGVAVCLLPGTELAFEQDVKYDQRWIWTRTTSFRVAKFGVVEPNVPHRHHDVRALGFGAARIAAGDLPVIDRLGPGSGHQAEMQPAFDLGVLERGREPAQARLDVARFSSIHEGGEPRE